MTPLDCADRAPASRVSPPLPRFVQIEPVGQCNLRCQMCAIQFREDGPPHGPLAFLGFDDFKRLVEGFGDIDELQLQGLGEPTMHPRFFDMVSWASARGIRVSTNSNLTLWSQRRARQCVESGLAALHVSLDAATPELYERIRRGAHFGKVIRNLRRVVEARRDADSPLHIRVVTVLMRQNLQELPSIVRLASDEGVAEVFVQYLCHDFEEHSLPEPYRPMRDFIRAQALDDVPRHVLAHAFARASGRRRMRRAPAASSARAPRGNVRGLALRLAMARRVCQLSRRRHAVLHGRHAGSRQFRQHARRRRPKHLGGRLVPAISRRSRARRAVADLPLVLALSRNVLKMSAKDRPERELHPPRGQRKGKASSVGGP